MTHLEAALAVVSQGQLKPGLVYDKSKLSDKRILVVWLSPNDWTGAGGFRYGNIGFKYDWAQLIDGKHHYWVEKIDYQPKALRILVTTREHRPDTGLIPYNPTCGDGPWWYDKDSDKHYWNSNYCLEIMVEKELELSDVQKLWFVHHHASRCCIAPTRCPDRKQTAKRSAARFIAAMADRKIGTTRLRMTLEWECETVPNEQLLIAWSELRSWLDDERIRYNGTISSEGAEAEPLGRAVLGAIARRRKSSRQLLSGLFRRRDDLVDCCASLIEEAFELGANHRLARTDEEDPPEAWTSDPWF